MLRRQSGRYVNTNVVLYQMNVNGWRHSKQGFTAGVVILPGSSRRAGWPVLLE